MINFNVEIEKFKITDTRKKKAWLKDLVIEQGFKLKELNYVFLSDQELLKMNIEYLKHDTYTDIITFDNSERENEIIVLIAEGLTNEQIAEQLFLSKHTVNTHRKNIMAKLGVKNTAGIVMYAVKTNLVSPNKFLFAPTI